MDRQGFFMGMGLGFHELAKISEKDYANVNNG
jgi:hypothetical protein